MTSTSWKPSYSLEIEGLVAHKHKLEAEIARLQELLRGVGANRYWEGRWRDAEAENARLRDLLAFNGIDPDATVESAKGAAAGYVQEPQDDLVECSQCGGSGFSSRGSGYDAVCGECGGQKRLPRDPVQEARCPYYPGCRPDHCTKCWEGDPDVLSPPKGCNGGYVRHDYACTVCGAEPNEDCRAKFR